MTELTRAPAGGEIVALSALDGLDVTILRAVPHSAPINLSASLPLPLLIISSLSPSKRRQSRPTSAITTRGTVLFLRNSDGGSALKPTPPGLTPTEQFGGCLAQLGVQPTLGQVREMSIQLGPPPPGFVADLPCAENEARRGRSFGFAPAFPSAGLSYQALTFYPALTYGVYADRIHRAILGLLDFGNGRLSGIIYRIEVASVLRKQGRHNARGVRFGKIADTEFHAHKIRRQPLIGNSRLKA
jgi:hypothetical protein